MKNIQPNDNNFHFLRSGIRPSIPLESFGEVPVSNLIVFGGLQS